MLMREEFFSYARDKNYTLLPETALNSGKDIYFVMAPVGAYTHLFSYERILHSTNSALAQRTISCDRIELTGEAPIANPCEVLGGYFRFADLCLNQVVAEAVRILCHLLDTRPTSFYVRTSDQLDFRTLLLSQGLPENQIIVCNQPKQLSLGAGCPKGEYMFFYMKYRHGIIPVASIGILLHEGLYATDSALFIERMTMIHESARYPSDCSLFEKLGNAIKSTVLAESLNVPNQHRWMFLARAVALCIRDGIHPSNAYAGHYVKKMLRMMAYAIREIPVSQIEIAQTTLAAVEDCDSQGYSFDVDQTIALGQLVGEKLLQYKRQINTSLEWVARLAEDKGITDEEANTLASQSGLRKKWMINYLEKNRLPHRISPEKEGYVLGYVGYPYEDATPVDLQALFHDAQERYSK